MTDKPPYRIPTMVEIKALPWNGVNVISTFSGCGGSSLGYRMAGCRVLLASEFVDAAADVYELNSEAIVDRRDIRGVHGTEWLDRLGLDVGELDVLDGSPPCASFSLAGKRHKTWGQVKQYSDTEQRTDDLFMEYARLLDEIKPRMFIAENVPGLRQGSAKGYLKIIHRRLSESGYRVALRELDSTWLGVPQSRKRLIFMGVRSDLDAEHRWPEPQPFYYSLRDALPYLDGQVCPDGSGPSTDGSWSATPGWLDGSRPSRTIGASPSTGNGRFPPMVTELATASNFHGVERFSLDGVSPTMTSCGMAASAHARVAVVGATGPALDEHGTLVDPETGYDIGNVSKTLRRYYPGRPLRRLTIAELRRICGFPDDFQLAGSYPQRWERLGRAVPPPMMRAVAECATEMLT